MNGDLIRSICWKISDFVATRGRNDQYGIFQQSLVNRADLHRVMNEYPATFVSPPKTAYSDLEVTEENDGTWSVEVPLWSKEEGASDLCLMLTFAQEGDDIRVSLDDCYVP
ncbi:hypothetical protein MesoLjLc_22320 [Mesorhizobium sp. L-8-10]|uniref:DUF7668 domain-containing protein n=1 Tax=Mesorhizobium sp. L-8-10 TaxID=2744523 RepID=UPI001927846C|nr:hypothetical protein [Mesorhizobium sp. L-8-10]BCH30302.1 hypothetical protein MesoLjLc_22320 [Mesorhizobium sp. L-8-10]